VSSLLGRPSGLYWADEEEGEGRSKKTFFGKFRDRSRTEIEIEIGAKAKNCEDILCTDIEQTDVEQQRWRERESEQVDIINYANCFC